MRTLHEPARDAIQLTSVLHAFSDPVRLQIVLGLADAGECRAGALETGVARTTLSHHLRVLREAGVTRTRVEGRDHLISLRYDDLDRRFPGLLPPVLAEAQRLWSETAATTGEPPEG